MRSALLLKESVCANWKPLPEATSTTCEEKSQPIRPDSEHKQSSFELLEDFSVDLRYLTLTALCEAVDAS
jgi:hypothetical protein